MGERTPHLDPDCRGTFVGLSAIHERGDLIRAVLEGVCYSLRDCLEILRGMGAAPELMRVCGGGGKSPLWRQMLADVFGMPTMTLESDEGPALGVAILAMVGAGLYPDVVAACDKIVRAKKTYQSNPDSAAKYAEFYKIYDRLYIDLKDDFKALAQL